MWLALNVSKEAYILMLLSKIKNIDWQKEKLSDKSFSHELTSLQQTSFENTCLSLACTLFATMFSTLFNNCPLLFTFHIFVKMTAKLSA